MKINRCVGCTRKFSVKKIPHRFLREAELNERCPGLCALGISWQTAQNKALRRSLGLRGAELLSGVPGHVGGALAMNAGSRDWGFWDQVERVWLLDPATGEVSERAREECESHGAVWAGAPHPDDDIDEDDEDSCPICFDIPKNGFRTPCGHVFCSTCLADALHRNDSCPVCRSRGVHTCVTRTDDCLLCVAGHKPGVVVANVFVSQEEGVLQSTARLAATFSKIWCQVTSVSIGTVVLGFWLCEIGVLSILSFAMVCIGVTLVCCLVIYYRTSRAINRVIPADIPA